LPPAAIDAMRRLELALSTPAVVRAVTRYEIASARTADLSAAMDERSLSGAEFDSLALAQDVMAEALDLLTAAASLATGYLRNFDRHGEYDAWLTNGRLLATRLGLTGDTYAQRQQLPAAARSVLAAVGQLHLVEVAR
jgi:hypothetical protein